MVYSNSTASITVWPSQTPSSVTLWQAQTLSSTSRDYRLVTCPQLPKCFNPVWWMPSTLQPNADGSYTASVSAPISGWIGFMIEVAYGDPNNDDAFWEVTSEVNIVPDIYPFPPCNVSGGCNIPSKLERNERKNKFTI